MPSPINPEILTGLLAVALTSRENVAARADALTELAVAYHSAGEEDACKQALEAALDHLRAAPEEATELGALAHGIGRVCIGIARADLAHSAYELAAEKLEDTGSHDLLAVVWHNLGASWDATGDGSRALEAYRRAAALREYERPSSILTTLCALADAEARWGTRAGSDQALKDAMAVLETLDPAEPATADEAERIVRLARHLGRAELARLAFELAGEALPWPVEVPGSVMTRVVPPARHTDALRPEDWCWCGSGLPFARCHGVPK